MISSFVSFDSAPCYFLLSLLRNGAVEVKVCQEMKESLKWDHDYGPFLCCGFLVLAGNQGSTC